MAGLYPDVPAPRMAYDIDGTEMIRISGTSPSIRSLGEKRILNNESDDYMDYGTGDNIAFIFPQLRDVSGYFVTGWEIRDPSSLQTSTNTTNGYDGTWTTIENPWGNSGVNYTSSTQVKPIYRSSIKSIAANGIKAIRFNTSANGGYHRWRCIHLYGSLSSYAGADTLRVWHPTLDEPLDDNTSADGSHLDWGDTPQGSTEDRQFRIRNNSASETAFDITIYTEPITNTGVLIEGQVFYSIGGGSFQNSISIGDLAPGATSGVVTVRRDTADNAALSVWSYKTVAEATRWA